MKMVGGASTEERSIHEDESQRTRTGVEERENMLPALDRENGPEEDAARATAKTEGLPYKDLEEIDVDTAVLQHIPRALAFKHDIVPVHDEGGTLLLACSKPLDEQVISNLRRLTGRNIAFCITTRSAVRFLLKKHYAASGRAVAGTRVSGESPEPSVADTLSDYVFMALTQRASDIHFEPAEKGLSVRFRIDGVLNTADPLRGEKALPLISRIKVLAGLDIAEKRAPQDGSFTFEANDGPVDVRVSVLPGIRGEKAVLRLLPSRGRKAMDLQSLGMEKDTLRRFESLARRPHGIVLITGPTGSGKSTTLYSALLLRRSHEVNITTIEDPVEYQIDGVTQTQVDSANKISFAGTLRHILRQDPDIIMVGEIRDKETADIALRAALTGHLVFSTLHTNSASDALMRLIDMGCEPYLVACTVSAILAQRLIRLNCRHCAKPFTPSPDEVEQFGVGEAPRDDSRWVRGQGCRRCRKTGFRGRTGIFELLEVDAAIQREIVAESSAARIREVALSSGMRTLREDGLLKVERGLTAPEEVLRLTVLN